MYLSIKYVYVKAFSNNEIKKNLSLRQEFGTELAIINHSILLNFQIDKIDTFQLSKMIEIP